MSKSNGLQGREYTRLTSEGEERVGKAIENRRGKMENRSGEREEGKEGRNGR